MIKNSTNNGRKRQIIEAVSEILPNIRIPVFSQTFIEKSINLGDLPTFVISSEDGDSFRISNYKIIKKIPKNYRY